MNYEKEIDSAQTEIIMNLFYKKNGAKKLLEEIMSITDSTSNRQVIRIVSYSYENAYCEWKTAMDNIECVVLGDMYRTFKYDFIITFATNTLQISTEDVTVDQKLINMGFNYKE